jgi:hypothetical protein
LLYWRWAHWPYIGINRLTRPDPLHEGKLLIKPLSPVTIRAWSGTKVILSPADSHTQREATLGKGINGSSLLGQNASIVQWSN